jgi:hypothetical protein
MAGRVPAIFAPADEARMAGTSVAMTDRRWVTGPSPVMTKLARVGPARYLINPVNGLDGSAPIRRAIRPAR